MSALIINCVPNRSDDEDPTRDVLSEKKRSLLDAQKRYHPVVKYGPGNLTWWEIPISHEGLFCHVLSSYVLIPAGKAPPVISWFMTPSNYRF